MNFIQKHFVDVKHGTKVTFSESDLRKLDKTYEKEVLDLTDRKVRSPMRKVLQQAYLTQLRDYAYERILDSHMYTFSHLLVVPNPYDIVKQSALLLFNSSKETKIRYRMFGDVPAADFTGETEYTTRHRVPVMGLYFQRSNRVELEMIDHDGEVVKRRLLRIYVSECPEKISGVLKENISQDKKDGVEISRFPFLLVNGMAFNPIAVDCEGKIRYSMQLRTNDIGMIPLEDGHFLYEDRTANRMNQRGEVMPCRYHEMDYMGRVYQTYLFDFPLCGVMAQNGDSLFAVTWSDGKHARDCLLEIDRRNGAVRKKKMFSEILGKEKRNRRDWVHLSKIICDGDELLLVCRRLHTIIKYDWKQEKIVWILAPEEVWKGSPVEEYLLKGEQNVSELCWKPEGASLVKEAGAAGSDSEGLTLFQLKSNTDIRLFPKNAEDSSFVYLRINRKEKSFRLVSETKFTDCKARGNGFFSEDKKGVLLCAGACRDETEGKGKISEFDCQTGREVRSFYTDRSINTVWEFEPDISRYGEVVPVSKDVIFGTLAAPQVFTGELPELQSERIPRAVFSGSRICGELYVCNMLPGTVSKVYLVGEAHAYVQDYTGMLEKRVKYPFVISLHELKKDTYHVYAEFEGKVYLIKNEIRILE